MSGPPRPRPRPIRAGYRTREFYGYLSERLIDELHLAVAPVLLGRGEALFGGMDWRELGYRCVEIVAGEKANHVVIKKQA